MERHLERGRVADQAMVNEEESPRPRRYVIAREGGPDPIKSKSTSLSSSEDVYDILKNWPNAMEKWGVLGSAPVLGLASVATGFFINRHFRETLYLVNAGRISSYLVMFMFPGITAGLTHHMRITDKILSNQEKCPVCTQVRAGIAQLVTGIVYPAILAPLVSYPIGSRQKSYNLPKLSMSKPMEIFVFTREMFRPIKPTLMYIAAFQVLLSMGFTYYEQNVYYCKIQPELKALKHLNDPAAAADLAIDSFDTSSIF